VALVLQKPVPSRRFRCNSDDMKYWMLLATPLLGCAVADTGARAGPQIVEATGTEADKCEVSISGKIFEISPAAFSEMAKDRQVLITASPATAYECVTVILDELNDLRIQAAIDETSWENLTSVERGRKKLQQDLAGESGHPEAQPFDRERDAKVDLDWALDKAKKSGNLAIVIMGANWCHDSRALSGWFASPRFARMISDQYELIYVDVGYKDRNIDIAQRFGFERIKGTPTVLVLSHDGKLLNQISAPSWRNAASRNEDDIFNHFDKFDPEI